MRFRASFAFLVGALSAAAADPRPAPEAIEYFEKHVRPILVEHCQSCHGPKKQAASLRLDSKSAVVRGGENGPVVVPGEPDKSALVTAVRQSGELKMPPKGRMSVQAVEALISWVKMGAPFPDDAQAAPADPTKSHWAFQPVAPVVPPKTVGAADHPIDMFVLSKLEAAKAAMSPPADKRTLIRRVTYDLTGLRPTPAEVEAFEKDSAPRRLHPHGRPPTQLAALWRASSPALDGPGPLLGHEGLRLHRGPELPVRVHLPRLADPVVQRRFAVRPVRPVPACRGPAGEGGPGQPGGDGVPDRRSAVPQQRPRHHRRPDRRDVPPLSRD